MSNLLRRLRKLEEHLTDPSGHVPHSQRWLAFWDRQVFNYMTDPERKPPPVLFTVEAFRAVMKHMSNPDSLVGSIPGIDE